MSQFPQSIQTMAEALEKYIAQTASVNENCIFITNKVKSLISQKKYFSHKQIILKIHLKWRRHSLFLQLQQWRPTCRTEKTDQYNLCQILTKI